VFNVNCRIIFEMAFLDSSINQTNYLAVEDSLGESRNGVVYQQRSRPNSESSSGSRNGVTDRYYGVYILFYLLGMATLLPWNFFITANEYWMYKLRDLNSSFTTVQPETFTPLQLEFTPYLVVFSLVPSTALLIMNAFVGHKFSFKVRIAGGLLGVVLLFTLTTALVEVDTDDWQTNFFRVTLTTAFLINVASAIFQGGVFGLAGKFPAEYINAMISGQALGGIFAALCNIITIALGASAIQSAFLYFLAADFTLLLSFVLYIYLSSTDFFLYYANINTSASKDDRSLNADDGTNDDYANGENMLLIRRELSYQQIICQIWPYLFSIGLLFAVTLSLFPAVTDLVESIDMGHGYQWNDVYFTPVVCFLLMNTSDYIGRAVVIKMTLPKHPRFWTCALSVLRIGFFPLIMLSNAQPRNHLPVLIQSDAAFIAIIMLFGFSNGYISNVCFTVAPKSVPPEGQEIASSMMAATLSIGLAVGGVLSNAVIDAL